jgi:hypothetical protein
MTEQENLLLNPLFRYGMPATTAVVIVAMAFLVVDDQIVRTTMLLVAAVDIVVTPWVLKRAGEQEMADTEPHNV